MSITVYHGPMVGNIADATLAVRASGADGKDILLSEQGSTRTVYLINDVVYKIENYSSEAHNYNTNTIEYANILRLRPMLPQGVRIPETTLFDIAGKTVIAMEYIEGHIYAGCWCTPDEEHTETCMPEYVKNAVNPYLKDISGENVIVSFDGTIYIIDLGE